MCCVVLVRCVMCVCRVILVMCLCCFVCVVCVYDVLHWGSVLCLCCVVFVLCLCIRAVYINYSHTCTSKFSRLYCSIDNVL